MQLFLDDIGLVSIDGNNNVYGIEPLVYHDVVTTHITAIVTRTNTEFMVDYLPYNQQPKRHYIKILTTKAVIESLALLGYDPAKAYIREQKINNLFS